MRGTVRDDRIFLVTRIVLGLVILVLILAFNDLYLNPQATAQNFAWNIQPQITAVLMGAGYISGAFMFIYAVFGRSWHRVKNSLLPVTVFASSMLVATLLHFDRFLHDHLAFQFWFVIYIITPFLVPWVWFNNRRTDPGTPEPGDRIIPQAIRRIVGAVGMVWILACILGFIAPSLVMSVWPWKLTPLTARVLCGWGALLATGSLVISRDARWSAWRYNMQAIALWQALMVIGSILHRQDFNNGSLANVYFIGIVATLVGTVAFYTWMELGLSERLAPARPSRTPL